MEFDFLLILSLRIWSVEMPADVVEALECIDVAQVCDRLLIVASNLKITCKPEYQ